MIRTLETKAELGACRASLASRQIDFTDPKRNRLWRALFHARFRDPLPPADFMKSWDVAHAVEILERAVPDRDTPILDMGCFNSEILYCLHGLGYRQLHGCDLNPLIRWMPHWNTIRYQVADLIRTPYADATFGALTCLSVIEHGVPIDGLVAEARRILRPGGVFLLTTDYDASGHEHAINGDFRVFGQPWRIFNPQTLDELLAKFQDAGLELLDPARVQRGHVERPVRWNDEDYTFVMVALRKSA